MSIPAEFDQSAANEKSPSADTVELQTRRPIQKTTLIFSVRLTVLAEALQWNVNGVDKMDFQCHPTFLKSFVCDPVPPVTTAEAASCWTNHLSQIANPRGITAYQEVVGWLCPALKWKGD